ncbi:MAG: hypothetical protein ABII22_02060 [Candidatus Micrarchaeota archaeon]
MKRLMAAILILMLVFGCTQSTAKKQEAPEEVNVKIVVEQEKVTVIEPEKKPIDQIPIIPVENKTQELPVVEPPKEETTVVEPAKTEKLSIPPEIEGNCIGFLVGTPEEMSTVNTIGASWVRPHPGPFVWGFVQPTEAEKYDFSRTDEYAIAAQKNNVTILATIWPFADWDQKKYSKDCSVGKEDEFYPSGTNKGIPAMRCKPYSMADYTKFLTKLVERYDGDGINDMPGLKYPIKYWEIINEPELESSTLNFFKGDQQDYLDVVKASYGAIKETCEDCKIVQGGAAGTTTTFLLYWKVEYQKGLGDYIDITNMHYVKSGDVTNLNTKKWKEQLNAVNISKPIWITEAEYKEKADMAPSFLGALRNGASKVFFTRFVLGSTGTPTAGKYSEEYTKLACR